MASRLSAIPRLACSVTRVERCSRAFSLCASRMDDSALEVTQPDPITVMSTESINSFANIAQKPFSKEVADILLAPVNENDVEIKPDGIVYLPEIKYRRILNRAFGPGGWAMMPRGEPSHFMSDGDASQLITREYAMFAHGQFVSQVVGEHTFYHRGQQFYGKACESAKSNAVMRCCKDLGIASELWDFKFIEQWKAKHGVLKEYKNARTKETRRLWKKKGGKSPEYPWVESK